MPDLPASVLQALLGIKLAQASLSEVLQRLTGIAKDSVPVPSMIRQRVQSDKEIMLSPKVDRSGFWEWIKQAF